MGRLQAGGAVLLCVISLVVNAGIGSRASAQEPPPDSTTTTTIPAPPDSTTSTTLPAPPGDPTANGDAPPETVPPVSITVPPRTGPYANQGTQSHVIRRQLRVARATALQYSAVHDAAVALVQRLQIEHAALLDRVGALRAEEQAAIRRLELAQTDLAERAANAYVRGGASQLTVVLGSSDANDYYQRVVLMSSVLDADAAAVKELGAAKTGLRGDLADTADAIHENSSALTEAEHGERVSAQAAQNSQFELSVFAAGSEIVITGFVFPVDDPHEFTDSFGAPRMVGTPFEHFHEGTDILAPRGTKLFATERGVITRMNSNLLGGITVWLRGESGTDYYYAHLDAYAKGLKEGMVVDAGTVLGYVGDTGDARGGPTHCHFEVHPEGGPAVNPYPLLKVVDDLRQAAP